VSLNDVLPVPGFAPEHPTASGLDPIRGWDDAPDRYDVDVVIVGAGPGGSAVARQVAASGASVLLLEDGPRRSRFRPSWTNSVRYHFQEFGTMLAEGPVPFPVMAGRGVGGGSLVNSAICFRTPEPVLREWAETLDDDRYLPEHIHPIYDEIEQRIGVVPVHEGIAGENNMIVARGVKALGPPLEGGLLRRNAPGCVGCGICNFGCPSGGKASVDRNLVIDAREGGCIVQAECRVEDVLVDGGRAVGVVGRLHDPDTRETKGRLLVRAGTVVLSAGAIGTPRLLYGCGLAKDLGPVGDQLHLHPGTGLLGLCDHEVHMWKGATQGAYCWTPEEPKVLPHTFNVPPEAFISMTGAIGMEAKQALTDINRICGLGVMVSDKGKGSVRTRKNGRAKLSYTWDPEDVETLKRGLILSARVLLAGGAKKIRNGAHGAQWHDTPEQLAAELARTKLADFVLYSAHPMSTNPMGRDGSTSVVGPTGRAHRLDGLWIADAGIFPTSLGVNPQLTTMVLGTMIGRQIAGTA